MDSAPSQNDRYIRYISAIRDGPLPVTAELIEMAQYVDCYWGPILELDTDGGGAEPSLDMQVQCRTASRRTPPTRA